MAQKTHGDEALRDKVTQLLTQMDQSPDYFDNFADRIAEHQLEEMEEFQCRGERIGNYRIEHLLGVGGMGSVFAANRADGAFNRTVIIKMLPLALDSPELRQRLNEEQRVLASLSHPNIAQLFDAGVDAEHGAYFIMEWVNGENIVEHCQRLEISRARRVQMFVDLLGAVQFAHENLIVHSDIKPSNVMVNRDGTVKLLDFGIAMTLEEKARQGGAAFSPGYAAPEQIEGGALTTATDTYQCGLLLFELLTGEAYSNCDDIEARLHSLPHELAGIIRKATDPNPRRRYPTARELAAEFERLRRHLPVSAVKPSLPYRLSCFIRRHQWASIVTALTIAFAVTMAWQARETALERDRAITASQQHERERERAVRVSDFLVSVFETARPENSPGTDPSAEQILQNGLARIRNQFVGLPSTKFELLLVIARTYQSLGRYSQAANILDEAEALVADHRLDGTQRARLLLHRGENQRLRGDLPAAITSLQGAITDFQTLAASDPGVPINLGEAHGRLGRVLNLQGRFADAREHLTISARLVREQRGETHLDYAKALNDLAAVDFSEGRHPAVINSLQAALDIRDELARQDPDVKLDPDYATNVNNLGLGYFRVGELDDAENHFRRAVALREQIYVDPHPEQAQSLTNLGLVLDAAGRSDEAREHLEQALAIRQQALRPGHMRIAESFNNLGMLHLSAARFEDALQQYVKAHAISAGQLGDDHPVTATIRSNMGHARLELGQLESALDDFKQSLRVRTERLSAGHLFISYSEIGLGRTQVALGRIREGMDHLGRGLAIRREQLPPGHWLIGEAELAVAQAHAANDQPDRAGKLAEHAWQVLQDSKGHRHYLTQRAARLAPPGTGK